MLRVEHKTYFITTLLVNVILNIQICYEFTYKVKALNWFDTTASVLIVAPFAMAERQAMMMATKTLW